MSFSPSSRLQGVFLVSGPGIKTKRRKITQIGEVLFIFKENDSSDRGVKAAVELRNCVAARQEGTPSTVWLIKPLEGNSKKTHRYSITFTNEAEAIEWEQKLSSRILDLESNRLDVSRGCDLSLLAKEGLFGKSWRRFFVRAQQSSLALYEFREDIRNAPVKSLNLYDAAVMPWHKDPIRCFEVTAVENGEKVQCIFKCTDANERKAWVQYLRELIVVCQGGRLAKDANGVLLGAPSPKQTTLTKHSSLQASEVRNVAASVHIPPKSREPDANIADDDDLMDPEENPAGRSVRKALSQQNIDSLAVVANSPSFGRHALSGGMTDEINDDSKSARSTGYHSTRSGRSAKSRSRLSRLEDSDEDSGGEKPAFKSPVSPASGKPSRKASRLGKLIGASEDNGSPGEMGSKSSLYSQGIGGSSSSVRSSRSRREEVPDSTDGDDHGVWPISSSSSRKQPLSRSSSTGRRSKSRSRYDEEGDYQHTSSVRKSSSTVAKTPVRSTRPKSHEDDDKMSSVSRHSKRSVKSSRLESSFDGSDDGRQSERPRSSKRSNRSPNISSYDFDEDRRSVSSRQSFRKTPSSSSKLSSTLSTTEIRGKSKLFTSLSSRASSNGLSPSGSVRLPEPGALDMDQYGGRGGNDRASRHRSKSNVRNESESRDRSSISVRSSSRSRKSKTSDDGSSFTKQSTKRSKSSSRMY